MSVPRGHGWRFTHQDIIEERMQSCGGILKQNIEDQPESQGKHRLATSQSGKICKSARSYSFLRATMSNVNFTSSFSLIPPPAAETGAIS